RYNIIHGFGSDGIRIADPDTIVDIYGNIIYGAEYGIHLPVDLTPAARVNAFSNTIYGCNAAVGPSGVKSDVRQTSVRVDLRNNIAHSNAGGDFGVGPLFDYGYFCNPGCTQIANGGVLGPTEFLADRSNNTPLDFTIVDTSCLYLGSARPFRGVSVALGTSGVLSGTDIQWDYWDGTSWASLEADSFADGTGNFQYTGHLFWPNDPPAWAPTSVNTSPDLYYVRACLAAGSYTTLPVEAQITRIDVSMSSRNNLSSDITGRPHSALWCGSTGVDFVPLPAMGFISTAAGAEDLHIGPGSAAEDTAFDFGRRFLADIDGALRVDPWDIGADEASASTGPDLAITKDDGQTTAVPGTPVLYTITVTNNGPGLLTSVTVLDAVPPELQGPFFTPSTGDYDPGTGVWSGLSLGPSASITLTLQGTIAPGALGNLVNTAQVDPPDGLSDQDRSNNSATDVDTLTPEADLALTKADDLDPIEIGNLLTYTLTITNTGPSDATGVILTDMLVPELDYQSATPSQGVCNFDAPTRTVGCTLGALASGGSAVVTLVVRPLAVGTLGNTADVSGNEPDPVSGNGSATETTAVHTASDGVRFFTVTSTFEQNVLEWLNPATAAYLSTEIVYRTDTFPTGPTDPLATSIYNGGVAGMKDRLVHATGAGTNGQTFYYGAFVHLAPGPTVSSGRFSSGRPFDNSGPVKWAFSTGAFSITPPTVGVAGVVAPANDRALYAMERGPLGGEWPAGWEPVQLGGAVQSRSPLVPLTVSGANPVVYLGAQDGKVYAVNGTLGGAAAFPWAPIPIGGMVQAAPAGIFTAWGGAQNYLLVGTRDDGAENLFVALNPDTPGNILGTFDNGGSPNGIGIITGMATVDYATNRVYFTSYENPSGSNGTLWCLQIGPPGPVLSLVWQRALHDIDGSPVVNGGRVYVGSTDAGGTVYSINAATGSALDDRTFVHGDGLVNGFVWPDRGSADLYFATDNFVWGISDTGAPNMPNKFPSGISLGGGGVTPSSLLFVPGSHYIYVGGSDGSLYEIDVLGAAPTLKSQPLGDGLATVGAPSLDWLYSLIHVGTEAGIFYAVDVPLP
ncbi:MAG: DUF11 domain-containing protein, partial [Acidobacteria bacterium]|nr:DUF11 domain-containing protein [Acidobacteriota bacterium]